MRGDALRLRFCGEGAPADGPIVRVTTPHVPLPSSDEIEDQSIPSADRVDKAVKKVLT